MTAISGQGAGHRPGDTSTHRRCRRSSGRRRQVARLRPGVRAPRPARRRRGQRALTRLGTHRKRVNASTPIASGGRIVEHSRTRVHAGSGAGAGIAGRGCGVMVVCRGRRSSNCRGSGRVGSWVFIVCRTPRVEPWRRGPHVRTGRRPPAHLWSSHLRLWMTQLHYSFRCHDSLHEGDACSPSPPRAGAPDDKPANVID